MYFPKFMLLGTPAEPHVSYAYLMELGVSKGTIDNNIARGTVRESHPEDERVKYINWDTLPKPTKTKVEALLQVTFGTAEVSVLCHRERSLSEAKPTAHCIQHYRKRYGALPLKAGMPEWSKADAYAKSAALFQWLTSIKGNAGALAAGYYSKEECYQAAMLRGRTENLPKLDGKHVDAVRRTAARFGKLWDADMTKAAWDVICHGLEKRASNASKWRQDVQDFIDACYANGGKLNDSQIYNLYISKRGQQLSAGVENPFPHVDPHTISNWLDLHRHETMIARAGKTAAYQKGILPQAKREKPKMKNTIWAFDFTQSNLYFKETTRKYSPEKQDYTERETFWNRPWTGFIQDGTTGKIINATFERAENIMTTHALIKGAVRLTGVVPCEFMHDGGGGAVGLKDMLDKMAQFNTQNQPYRSRPKFVEGFISHYQNMLERHSPWANWGGGNITAKTEDMRANDEWRNAHKHLLPTWEQSRDWFMLCIQMWNELATEIREKPNYLWANTECGGNKVDEVEFLQMFWMLTKRKYRYRGEGITVKIDNQEVRFQALEQPSLHLALLGNEYRIEYDPGCPEMCYLYTVEGKPVLDNSGEHAMLAAEGTIPMSLAQKGDNKARGRFIKERNNHDKYHDETIDRYRRMAEEMGIDGPIAATAIHDQVYKRVMENQQNSLNIGYEDERKHEAPISAQVSATVDAESEDDKLLRYLQEFKKSQYS